MSGRNELLLPQRCDGQAVNVVVRVPQDFISFLECRVEGTELVTNIRGGEYVKVDSKSCIKMLNEMICRNGTFYTRMDCFGTCKVLNLPLATDNSRRAV
jgi:hypothetical protein